VKMRAGKPFYFVQIATILAKRRTIRPINRKRQTSSEMFVFILKEEKIISSFLLFIRRNKIQQYKIEVAKQKKCFLNSQTFHYNGNNQKCPFWWTIFIMSVIIEI
ncbi:hypothetical protein, partial [Streptococcus suis]